LDFISEYLKINNFNDVLYIHIIPIIITLILIWGFPYITHEAYKASEKFRKLKAIHKKNIDEEISDFKDQKIKELNTNIQHLEKRNNKMDKTILELKLLAEYLTEEIELYEDESYEKQKDIFLEQFNEDISEKSRKGRLFALIEDYNSTFHSRERFLKELDESDLNFLSKCGMINGEDSVLRLSDFGEFVSKNVLFDKYSDSLLNFHDYRDLNN
jgi:vacuolar-type H+-ATPase subunit I/STV1